jgi:hypothetical protein
MEIIEMPMAQGVAAPVTINTAPTLPTQEMGVEFHQSGEVFSSLNNNASSLEKELDSNIMTADMILESAKSNGFETTLTDLASGKFDDPTLEEVKQTMDQKDEAVDEKEEIVKDEEIVNPYESIYAINNDPIAQFGTVLKEVQNRVANIEGDYVPSDAFIDAMLLLAEMKKAKNEKEKLGLFQRFVMALTQILIEIAPKEGGDYAESSPKGHANGQEKPINIEDIRKSLVKKGMIKPRPAVENKAA